MKIRRKYTPIYKNATVLLRPKTGLKDMIIELDPGTPTRRAGARRAAPSRSTRRCPNVNLDEILASLDADTRDYLQLLRRRRAARALDGQRQGTCRPTFKRFEPTGRDLAKINGAAGRAATQHPPLDPQLPAARRGARRQGRRSSPRSSTPPTRSSRRFANQDANLRETLQLLPGTLTTTNTALAKADQLGQRARARRSARCGPAPARSARRWSQTRPFLRADDADHPEPAAARSRATRCRWSRTCARRRSDLARVTPEARRPRSRSLNYAAQRAGLQPAGQGGGLPVLGRRGPTTPARRSSRTQDAHGPIRRGLVLVSCSTLRCSQQLSAANPQLGTLGRPAQPARPDVVCPTSSQAGDAPAAADRPPAPTPPCAEAEPLDAEAGSRPSAGILVMVGLRAVVLRPAAVPVAGLRRPGPAASRRATASTSPSARPTQLAQEADVRISGVSVGKVKDIDADKQTGALGRDDRARRQVRADPQGHQAILRQKTLLGETYVELTPGPRAPGTMPEDGTLPRRRGVADRRARRDLPRLRPARRARRSRSGCSSSALAVAGPRAATSPTRSATSRRSREDTNDAAEDPQRAAGRRAAAGPQHRRGLRRAERARRPAALADHELQPRLRRPPRRATSELEADLPRPADVRARVARRRSSA